MSTRRRHLDGRTADEWGLVRARAARRHHPDLGGDVDSYLKALRDVDLTFGVGATGKTEVLVRRDRSSRAALARALVRARRASRRTVARVPRRWRPGRTYIDL